MKPYSHNEWAVPPSNKAPSMLQCTHNQVH
jgi:hypothetical protein